MKYLKLFEELSKPEMSDELYKQISLDEYYKHTKVDWQQFDKSDVNKVQSIPYVLKNFILEVNENNTKLQLIDPDVRSSDFEYGDTDILCLNIGDDWFTVEDACEDKYYICDTIDGLINCITYITS